MGRENLKPEFRGDEASGRVFGPEVPIAEDAPLYDRLAAFFGRIPAEEKTPVVVHYLEIVSHEADPLTALYQRLYGLSFGPPDPDLGQARVATRAEGTLVGIRQPPATHEQPIMRTYIAVDDIQQAVTEAVEQGATIAYPPTRQGQRGTFAIVIQGGVEHGLWQR